MKNKKSIIYNFIILLILSIITGILIIRLSNNSNKNTETYLAEEKVTDDCIYEEDMLKEEIIASSTEIKISPNASMTIIKHYAGCGHTIKEYADILSEMVNKNQEEIEEMYPNFKIQSFAHNNIVVEKEEIGFCGEHFVLRDNNGTIVVNVIDENNNESLYETTSISTEYLTQTDNINLEDGIRIYGKENLNSMLEDYE